MTCGVYRIRHLLSGKMYIGSARDMENGQWVVHRYLLDHPRHSHWNRYLQFAWDKYGPDAFVFEIIEETSIEDLLIREQFYLDLYWPTGILYNINPVASRPPRREELDPETLQEKDRKNRDRWTPEMREEQRQITRAFAIEFWSDESRHQEASDRATEQMLDLWQNGNRRAESDRYWAENRQTAVDRSLDLTNQIVWICPNCGRQYKPSLLGKCQKAGKTCSCGHPLPEMKKKSTGRWKDRKMTKIEGSDIDDINVYYPENGPGTNSLNFGIERILREEGLLGRAQTPSGVPCILRLERYIQSIVRISQNSDDSFSLNMIDMFASIANVDLLKE